MLDSLISDVKTGRLLEKDIYQRAADANAAIEDRRAALLAKVSQANKLAGVKEVPPPRPTRPARGNSSGVKGDGATSAAPPPRPTRPSRRNKQTKAQEQEQEAPKAKGADAVKVDAFLNRLQGI